MAFAVWSLGSDSLPVVSGLKNFYGSDVCVHSIPATEHSVMCAGGKDTELETIRRIMELHPTGTLAQVMDTWDLWNTVDVILPLLKDEIMARDGKLVVRPDSSPTTPADILCGYEGRKGLIQSLWDIFGGTKNSKGYKLLDSHIGAIYGEAIDQDMLDEIYDRLDKQGFAASNVVVGIGSYAQTYVTRDTYGQAIKATAIVVKGELIPIFKDPKTSSSFNKKSAKGLMMVYLDADGEYQLKQECTWEEESQGELREIYREGKMLIEEDFETIRKRALATL